MKNLFFLLPGLVLIFPASSNPQPAIPNPPSEAWTIVAENIDPANYYGITVANGMIGLVSSPEPMKVKDVVLNGAYDNYQRGRVSNILKGFNFVNMELDVDGRRVGRGNISGYRQKLD
ncbi:MAG: glycoside hydrolase family 65 protein, partial [Thermoanaerobaculia bacterium]|nr:glycoside hydrolase family 65 protein [Thermoanaerobaculia bacterium]